MAKKEKVKKEKPVILHKSLKHCPKKRKDCVGCEEFEDYTGDHNNFCVCNSLDWPEPKGGFKTWKTFKKNL